MSIGIRGRQVLGLECDHCFRAFVIEGKVNIREYEHDRVAPGIDLCPVCCRAYKTGRFEYRCEACNYPVCMPVEHSHECVNVHGYALCEMCMRAFFGTFELRNLALAKAVSRRGVSQDRQTDLAREQAYRKAVVRQTKATYRANADRLNPQRRMLGPSGRPDAYQVDHIVPVAICFSYRVPEADCASAENLQVVPWLVNVVRNDRFAPETMIGAPGRTSQWRSLRRLNPVAEHRAAMLEVTRPSTFSGTGPPTNLP